MKRCRPLLGTYVEIVIKDEMKAFHGQVISEAFLTIELVQNLMGFHQDKSELSKMNHAAHLRPIQIHPWTAQVLLAAKDVHHHSGGLFDCGIGHRLIAAGLLPQHLSPEQNHFGGLADVEFLEPHLIYSRRPIRLDLGGIAKGFAVDLAVQILQTAGIARGVVNAGGDLRVFGDEPEAILLRDPNGHKPPIEIGKLQNGAIATSGLYFSSRDSRTPSHIINPTANSPEQIHHAFLGSYSVLAQECIYADALTKVFILSENAHHACFDYFKAKPIRIDA
jgi:FAD:protein FMN transferase